MQKEKEQQSPVEENVYADVYRVLLAGMFLSTALFAIGVIHALLIHDYFPLSPAWVQQHSNFHVVIHGLGRLEPTAYMLVATVLLILTPVLRVLVSIYAFWVDHDWKYVGVTGAVFLIMILTFVLSRFGLQ